MDKDLKSCIYKRGQVWENPDGNIMLVTDVMLANDGNYRITYIDEDGGNCGFWSCDKAITNNITLVSLATDCREVDVEALKREVINSIPDDLYSPAVCGWVIDHLTSRNLIRGAVEPIEGLGNGL